jgi:hypothetical protein
MTYGLLLFLTNQFRLQLEPLESLLQIALTPFMGLEGYQAQYEA